MPSHKEREAPGTSTNLRLDPEEDIKITIVSTLRDIMGIEVDHDEPLIAQGLDSLAAVELRKRIQVQSQTCRDLNSYVLSGKMHHDNDHESLLMQHYCMYGRHLICMQEIWAIELTILIDDPARATIKHLTTEIYAALNLHDSTQENVTAIQRSEWISPTPISIKMRLFCLPYAGGVSENIFAKFVPYISLNTITSMRGDV